MKNVLYIGNQLQHRQGNPTTIDTLSVLFEKEGYHVITASKKQSKIWRFFDMAKHVIANRKQTDYVLIDTYSTQNFYYAVMVGVLSQWFKLKYIPILHGGDLPKRLERSPRWSRMLFTKAFALASPSLYLKEAFKAQGYENVTYIPNSLELENYPYLEERSKAMKLLWVRSFAKIYNPQMAVDVAKGLIEGGYPVELCMVGPEKDGSLEATEAYAKALKIPVKFTGKLSKTEWINLSRDYSVFINTTHFDNMPVSVIEAMALGLPVVSTNVGGLSYLIENKKDGLLVEDANVEAMVHSIKNLHTDDALYKALQRRAKAKVAGFDWKLIKEQWYALLK